MSLPLENVTGVDLLRGDFDPDGLKTGGFKTAVTPSTTSICQPGQQHRARSLKLLLGNDVDNTTTQQWLHLTVVCV